MQITPSAVLFQALSQVTSPQGAARTATPEGVRGTPHATPTSAAADARPARQPNPPANPPPARESGGGGVDSLARFRRGAFLDIRV